VQVVGGPDAPLSGAVQYCPDLGCAIGGQEALKGLHEVEKVADRVHGLLPRVSLRVYRRRLRGP
jgi:hypothetical protein